MDEKTLRLGVSTFFDMVQVVIKALSEFSESGVCLTKLAQEYLYHRSLGLVRLLIEEVAQDVEDTTNESNNSRQPATLPVNDTGNEVDNALVQRSLQRSELLINHLGLGEALKARNKFQHAKEKSDKDIQETKPKTSTEAKTAKEHQECSEHTQILRPNPESE